MKTIYINENRLSLLQESDKRIVYKDVFDSLKEFLKQLLNTPSEASVNALLAQHGYDSEKLIKRLKKLGMLTAKENIVEVPIDEAKKSEVKGKQRAKHTIQYFLNRKRFIEKADQLCKEILSDINETRSVFADTNNIIKNIKDMDVDGAYATRCGYKLKEKAK